MSDLEFNTPKCKELTFDLETKYEVEGEGTDDYNSLRNQPSINGKTLKGDLTSSDLNIPTLESVEDIASDITDLSSSVDTLESTVTTHTASIIANTQAIQNNADNIGTNTQAIATNTSDITTNASAISNLQTALTTETTNRENADTNLQSQIDALVSKSDVVDIVGTYAQLQAYDTSTLDNNDIVKVLEDNTHDNAMSYYRWNATTQQWAYIGSEGAYYTKSESDSRFVPATRTINNKALSGNITLDASDVGAQEELVSGANIKTINSQSLLGQGNIDIDNVFVATYGTTTLAELRQALSDNKQIVINWGNRKYIVVAYINQTSILELACVSWIGVSFSMLLFHVSSNSWQGVIYSYPSSSYLKTINNESVVGNGDISLPTSSDVNTMIDSKLKAITNEEIDEIMGV